MLPPRARPARTFAALAAFFGVMSAVAGVIATACGDEAGVDVTRSDSGGTRVTPGESVCPSAAPDAGAACLLPEGTTCAFGSCGSRLASCTFGAWRFSGNPPPNAECPKDFPVSESACPACWPLELECTYGSSECSQPDASARTTVASCVDGGADRSPRWLLRSFPCAITDAGADVQRDAETDAD